MSGISLPDLFLLLTLGDDAQLGDFFCPSLHCLFRSTCHEEGVGDVFVVSVGLPLRHGPGDEQAWRAILGSAESQVCEQTRLTMFKRDRGPVDIREENSPLESELFLLRQTGFTRCSVLAQHAGILATLLRLVGHDFFTA
jgi:hypothetical protein